MELLATELLASELLATELFGIQVEALQQLAIAVGYNSKCASYTALARSADITIEIPFY